MITLSASAAFGKSGQYIARITGRHSKYTFEREFLGRKTGKRNDVTEADVDTPGLYECCDVDRKGSKDSRYVLVVADDDTNVCEYDCSKEDAMKLARELDSGRPFGEVVRFVPTVPASPLGAARASLANHRERLIANEASRATGTRRIAVRDPMASRLPAGTVGLDGFADIGEVVAYRRAEISRLEAEIATREAAGEPDTPASDDGWEFVTLKEATRMSTAHTLESAVEGCWTLIQALPEREAKKVLAALKARLSPPPATVPTAEPAVPTSAEA